MSELQDFKDRVDSFLLRTGMATSAFGFRFAKGDRGFVLMLRGGREPRSDKRNAVLAAMEAYDEAHPETAVKKAVEKPEQASAA